MRGYTKERKAKYIKLKKALIKIIENNEMAIPEMEAIVSLHERLSQTEHDH